MSRILKLTEWRTSQPLRLTSAERAGLERHFDASIASGPTADTFLVTPTNVIGTMRVGDTDVLVTPKIPIDRVLFMVAYARDPMNWKDDWARLAGTKDLVDGIAALFVHTSDRVLARGLYRSYRRVEDNELAVRGRIRWQQQARRPAPLPLAVRYDVHDDDVQENQVIRAALAVLRHMRLGDPTVAAGIARLWRDFKDLTALAAPAQAFNSVAWNRQNEHYRPLIDLAGVILHGTMTELDDGALSVPGFTLSMPRVFEQFVRTVLREQSGLTPAELPDAPAEHRLRFDTAGRVRLLPDIGVRVNDRWIFIGDVKYKRDDGRGRDGDLYQLLAYATAAGLSEATLIYADGPAEAPHHTVRHTAIRINLLHLDLSQPPNLVLSQLKKLRVPSRQSVDTRVTARSGAP